MCISFFSVVKGLPCTVYNKTYDNGETFRLDCRTQCTCQVIIFQYYINNVQTEYSILVLFFDMTLLLFFFTYLIKLPKS